MRMSIIYFCVNMGDPSAIKSLLLIIWEDARGGKIERYWEVLFCCLWNTAWDSNFLTIFSTVANIMRKNSALVISRMRKKILCNIV